MADTSTAPKTPEAGEPRKVTEALQTPPNSSGSSRSRRHHSSDRRSGDRREHRSGGSRSREHRRSGDSRSRGHRSSGDREHRSSGGSRSRGHRSSGGSRSREHRSSASCLTPHFQPHQHKSWRQETISQLPLTMIEPVHSTYGFVLRRRSPNLSTSAPNLARNISDISSQTTLSSALSSFKDEQVESSIAFDDKASSSTPLSVYTIPDSELNPRKTKKFLPDPPEDSSVSDFSEITNRSLAMKSTMDDMSVDEDGSSKLCLSIGKLKRRLRPDDVPKDTPAADQLQRTRDLEVVRDFAKRISAAVDPSMTLYLERTLYAALQQSWLLAAGGVGVMTVGNDSPDAINLGIMLISLSLISAIGALVLHYVRLSQIKSGKPFMFWQTFLFTFLMTLCILTALGLEMYYGILYPYLLRTASVKAANPEVLQGAGNSKNN